MSGNSKAKRDAKKKAQKRTLNRKKDTALREKQKVPTIYFDESGNTGSNLLDPDQPVFTLASCQFSENASKQLIELLNSSSPPSELPNLSATGQHNAANPYKDSSYDISASIQYDTYNPMLYGLNFVHSLVVSSSIEL